MLLLSHVEVFLGHTPPISLNADTKTLPLSCHTLSVSECVGACNFITMANTTMLLRYYQHAKCLGCLLHLDVPLSLLYLAIGNLSLLHPSISAFSSLAAALSVQKLALLLLDHSHFLLACYLALCIAVCNT